MSRGRARTDRAVSACVRLQDIVPASAITPRCVPPAPSSVRDIAHHRFAQEQHAREGDASALAWRCACMTFSMATQQPSQREQPKPPFPAQRQDKPGLESTLEPRPHYEAPAYKAAGKLEGKRALITGGDSGIGRAVAVLFAREGADVAINYLAEEQSDAEETRRAVEQAGRRCALLPGDLTEARFCAELIDRTVDQLGGLDILVSNAGYQNRKQID